MEIIVDPFLRSLSAGALPDDWATRAIFSHSHTAALWGLRAKSQVLDHIPAALVTLVTAIKGQWKYFISLGAGGGLVDGAILSSLGRPMTAYVPIDLTGDMCILAGESLREVCEVPFGIVADFEARFEFVECTLRSTQGHNRLFSCIGNTLGNLDLGEERFLANICSIMSPGDHLMLSVSTESFDASSKQQPLNSTYRWEHLGELLAAGMSMITGEDITTTHRDIHNRVNIRPGSTDVPGASAMQLLDCNNGRVLLHLRRYDFMKLNSWIEKRFPLKIRRSVSASLPSQSSSIGASIYQRSEN